MPDRYRAGKRLWSADDIAAVVARYPHEPTTTLAQDLRRTVTAVYQRAQILRLTKSPDYLAGPDACRLRRGDQVGHAHRFPKGHVPANKGLRRPGWGPGRMRETQFKKGQAVWNWRAVGTQRLVDGYFYTKVSDLRNVSWTRNWRPTHVLLWENHHGPIPRAHVVTFVNGDRTDVRLDNLKLISRRELMARNTVHNLPKPLVETIQLLGALNRRIRRRTKGHEEQDRRPA